MDALAVKMATLAIIARRTHANLLRIRATGTARLILTVNSASAGIATPVTVGPSAR